MRYKIKPYQNYDAKTIIEALEVASPLLPSLAIVRAGIRSAVKRMRRELLGIIDDNDVSDVGEAIAELYADANDALFKAVTIMGYSTAPLSDLVEYQAFCDVALPMRGDDDKKKLVINSKRVQAALARHEAAMATIKAKYRSAPRYRKTGHDYFEDMLENVCRVVMRPALGRFAKVVESSLGWTQLEGSGLLDHVKIKRHH